MFSSSKFKVTCGLQTLVRPHREEEEGKPDPCLQICIWEPQESGQIHSRKSGISKISWRTENMPKQLGKEPL